MRHIATYKQRLERQYPHVNVKLLARQAVAIDNIAIQHFRAQGLIATPIRLPRGNTKEELAGIISDNFEGGKALIPARRESWLEQWQNQHLSFPGGLHDDWVETTIVGLWYLSRRRPFVRSEAPTYLYGEI